MKRMIPAVLLLCLASVNCSKSVSTRIHQFKAGDTFQALLDEAVNTSYNAIPGVSMSIRSQSEYLNWSGVSGYDSGERDQLVEINQPFRIASVTKTFVAAAILRLHELDSLSIFDDIGQYIKPEHLEILIKGGYAPDSISIKQCLHHTSGLFDYAVGSQTFAEICKNNPNKRWTRTEQLEGAMQWGSRVGEPGERYYYSDTGYILLGEIVERFFNGSLAYGIRTLLKFDVLDINHTWLETLETHADMDVEPVHRYFFNDDVTLWDPSVDLYGGGGLVSVTPDLTTFLHSLFNHQIFDDTGTLQLMLAKPDYDATYDPDADPRFKDYRLGLWRDQLYGHTVFMHNGLWGVQALHIPDYNSTVAINYTKGARDRLMKKTILAIKQYLDRGE